MAALDWRGELAKRPWWMNLMFGFCLYMAIVYLPYDLFFKPVATDAEVWFGLPLHGWWAKLTEPVHWFIYAAGAYGFWKMSAWMWPWAALYVAQVAIGMFVWSAMRGSWVIGVVAAVIFAVPTVALWRARSSFRAA